jgi:beta-lactam-binding protein with PASTA domain
MVRLWAVLIGMLAAILVAGCGGSSSSPTTTAGDGGSRAVHTARSRVPEVRVPELVGERFGAAVRRVERAGLKQTAPAFTGTVGNPHFNGHCQRILHQSPPPGTKVAKGYTVSIVYGVCPKSLQHFRPAPYPTSRGWNRGKARPTG